jgi:AcrR family transcriptional regulator
MALVGRLYGSKAELWSAVIEHLAERQQQHMVVVLELAAAADMDPDGTFRKFIAHFAQISYEMPEFPAFLIQEAGNPGPRLDTIVHRLVVPFRIACEPIIEAAMKAGIIKPAHPELFFGMLISSIALPMVSPTLFSRETSLSENLRDQIASEAIRMFM